MVREKPDNPTAMTRYLGRRVVLSAVVILFLILALKLGWIIPNQRPY